MNCKTRNRKNQKNRENFLLKATFLGLLAFAWIIAYLIVSGQKAAGSAVLASDDGLMTELENDEIVPDDGETVPNETEPMPGSDMVLAGGNSFGDSNELAGAVNSFLSDVADELGLVETEEDFSGAPSNIPKGALSRPETEAIVEETDEFSETEEIPETEVVSETEAPVETEPAEKQISDYPYDEDQAVALAQLMWAEARGCSKREQSLVAWTVLNRVDACYSGMNDFWSILTAPYQFAYYSGNPYEEYEYRIAVDVLQRWAAEKDGVEDSGRTLPKGYLYYYGDGVHNYFGMNGFSNELWFGLGDPYENW